MPVSDKACNQHVFNQISRSNLARCLKCEKVIFRPIGKFMKNKILSLLLIVAFVSIFTACPKTVNKTAIEKGFNYSEKISNVVAQSAIAVGDLYDGKFISYETKEKIVLKLKLIQTNNERLLNVLRELKREFKGDVPNERISALDVLFSQSVITPFAEILTEIGLLSKESAQKVYLAVAALKQIIFTISNYFGKFSSDSVSFRIGESLKENYAV